MYIHVYMYIHMWLCVFAIVYVGKRVNICHVSGSHTANVGSPAPGLLDSVKALRETGLRVY